METCLRITLSHLSLLALLSCLSLPYWHLAPAQAIVFLIVLPSAELFLTELRAGVVVYSQKIGIRISINHFRRVNPCWNSGNTLTLPNACSMLSTFGFLDAKLAYILWILGNFDAPYKADLANWSSIQVQLMQKETAWIEEQWLKS